MDTTGLHLLTNWTKTSESSEGPAGSAAQGFCREPLNVGFAVTYTTDGELLSKIQTGVEIESPTKMLHSSKWGRLPFLPGTTGLALTDTAVELRSVPIPPSADTLKYLHENPTGQAARVTESTPDVSGAAVDETEASCQLEFGSYCLGRDEHKYRMQDPQVQHFQDQLFVARASYPSVAKLPTQAELARAMQMIIQEYESMLSDTTTDSDLPLHVEEKMQKMDAVISKAKEHVASTSNVDKKFRQLIDLTEDEAHFHRKQSAFLYQLAVDTVPRTLHCLSLGLTVEYFSSHSVEATVNQVFHVVIEGQNYFALQLWFFSHKYQHAVIDVLNIDDLNLKHISAGKVDGAVEYYRVRLGQLRGCLGSNSLDNNSYAWISALNVIEQERWGECHLTETYWRHLKPHGTDKDLKSVGTLPGNMLAFQNWLYTLDNSWALLGLGYNYCVDTKLI
ncbi:probable galacturonosyltransferase 7 [Aristolochia californica]|uniref:probable galacturonosyltransferase 7 n=1 Tax=Aristolochia californica TaxID=171875 RepID=UPI0035E004E3